MRLAVLPLALAAATPVMSATPALARDKPSEAHLVSFGGHGTTDTVVIRGRAQKGKPGSGAHGRGRSRKVFSTIHAFTRRDLERPRIVFLDGTTHKELAQVTGDKDGFFEGRLSGPFPAGNRRFVVKLAHPGYAADAVAEDVAIVDAAVAGAIVVTDIDDTIIDTGVTGSRMDLIKKILSSNAEDIKALPGAAEALRAHAAAGIPIVYVSASPVALGPRLMEFLRLRGFPGGALFLRDWDVDGKGDPTPYKRRMFKRVADDYPKRRMLLFGDNGEKDPEIFLAFARDTGRVAATFIRVTIPAKATEPRYQGIVLFKHWADVVRLSSPHAPGLDPQGRRP